MVWSNPRFRLVMVAAMVAALGCAACAINIVAPTDGAAVPVPVQVQIQASNSLRNLQVFLDGQDVTAVATAPANMLPGAPANARWFQIPAVAPGQHELRIRADVWQGAYWTSAGHSVSFTAQAAAPGALAFGLPLRLWVRETKPQQIERGTAGAGALTIALAASNQNIVLNPTTVTMGAAATTASVNVTGRARGSADINATAAPGGATGSVTVAVRSMDLFRATDSLVQAFRFDDPTAPAFLGQASVDPSSGTHFVVALDTATVGGNRMLVRSGSTTMQSIALNAGSTPGVVRAAASVDPTVNGVDVAASENFVFRATDTTLQAFELLADGTFRPIASSQGVEASAGGVAVDILGTVGVRAYDSGMRSYVVGSNSLAAGETISHANPGTSSRGVDVALYEVDGEVRGVQVGESAIHTFRIQENAIQLRDTAGGAASAGGVAVAISADGTKAVRSGDITVELYDISNPAAIELRSTRSVPASGTGVALAIMGDYVFRSSEEGIQVLRINGTQLVDVNLSGSNQATVSQSGTGLAILE